MVPKISAAREGGGRGRITLWRLVDGERAPEPERRGNGGKRDGFGEEKRSAGGVGEGEGDGQFENTPSRHDRMGNLEREPLYL